MVQGTNPDGSKVLVTQATKSAIFIEVYVALASRRLFRRTRNPEPRSRTARDVTYRWRPCRLLRPREKPQRKSTTARDVKNYDLPRLANPPPITNRRRPNLPRAQPPNLSAILNRRKQTPAKPGANPEFKVIIEN